MPPDAENMHREFGEVWPCGFRDILVDRRTESPRVPQTLTILRTPTGSDVGPHYYAPSPVVGSFRSECLYMSTIISKKNRYLNFANFYAPLPVTVAHRSPVALLYVIPFRFCG